MRRERGGSGGGSGGERGGSGSDSGTGVMVKGM